MERLPPIAHALRCDEFAFPRSLILFLQCAPYAMVLAAFQADCENHSIHWCSPRAQQLAVEWFLRHPVAQKYPPRRRMLRALLKSYITSIEEQSVADMVLSSASSSEDTVQLELMEAYIELSVATGDDSQGTEMCFKVFFNPYVGTPEMAAAAAMAGGGSSSSFLPQSLNHAPTLNSPTVQLLPNITPVSYFTLPEPPQPPATATGLYRVPRSISEQSRNTVLSRATSDGDAGTPTTTVWRSTPLNTPPPPPLPHFPVTLAQPPSMAKVLEQFCAIRVSAEQFCNVGLSLWPAAFVLAQLLAQEFKGQTHLLSDVFGLPRAPPTQFYSAASPMPVLHTPHGLHPTSVPTPPENQLTGGGSNGRGRRGPFVGGGGATAGSGSRGYSSQLHILELGAGVGLTPVFLNHIEEYRQHVSTFLATDYQKAIVDNIKFNLRENNISVVEDFVAAKRGLEGDQSPPYHRAAILDWTKHLENEGDFIQNGVNVALAADCIYDVDVIPALVDTIHLALTTEDTTSYLKNNLRPFSTVVPPPPPPPPRMDADPFSPSARSNSNSSSTASATPNANPATPPQKQNCCIVVQTHRQNSTMQTFFSAVRSFAQVRSYSLIRGPAGAMRLSQDNSGVDGDCVPLGGWDRQWAQLNPDKVVCALRPDVVLEDGSLRSSKCRAGNVGAHGSVPVLSAATTTASSALPRRSSRSRSSYSTPLRTVGNPNGAAGLSSGGKDTLTLTPPHSNCSNNSIDSRVSFSRNSSMAVVEAADTLLADEMIGPFYTTMVGLIGVHVLTLKPTKKVKR